MRRIRCYDCGKQYDFDKDDFCPRCGAFTQPARASRIGADGSVVRQDGINERGHENSFVHKEYHAENRKRGRGRPERTGRLPKLKIPAELKPLRQEKKTGKRGQGVLAAILFIIYFLYLFMR